MIGIIISGHPAKKSNISLGKCALKCENLPFLYRIKGRSQLLLELRGRFGHRVCLLFVYYQCGLYHLLHLSRLCQLLPHSLNIRFVPNTTGKSTPINCSQNAFDNWDTNQWVNIVGEMEGTTSKSAGPL